MSPFEIFLKMKKPRARLFRRTFRHGALSSFATGYRSSLVKIWRSPCITPLRMWAGLNTCTSFVSFRRQTTLPPELPSCERSPPSASSTKPRLPSTQSGMAWKVRVTSCPASKCPDSGISTVTATGGNFLVSMASPFVDVRPS